jgi:hypothetical protein
MHTPKSNTSQIRLSSAGRREHGFNPTVGTTAHEQAGNIQRMSRHA